MKKMVLEVVLLASALPVLVPLASADNKETGKAVLVTGASTGIGRSAAERLAASGFHVYAGARKERDLAALNDIDNISAIRLDVTKQEEIDAAVARIAKEGRTLWGVVNNAGVNVIEPLIEADESNLDFLFNVNVYGVFRITKAFAPMIIESKGRIVNIGSISGVLSGGIDGYGFYSMSKHAVEAFSDQLAWELTRFDVQVSSILPGNYQSQIGVTRCRKMLAETPSFEYYQESMQGEIDYCKHRLSAEYSNDSLPPDAVADAVLHALSSDVAKEHYLVVPDQFQAEITIRKSFEELLNLNQGHDSSYSRAELIELMDDELAILRGEKERNWGPDG